MLGVHTTVNFKNLIKFALFKECKLCKLCKLQKTLIKFKLFKKCKLRHSEHALSANCVVDLCPELLIHFET